MKIAFVNQQDGRTVEIEPRGILVIPRTDDIWILPELGWQKVTRVEINVTEPEMKISCLTK